MGDSQSGYKPKTRLDRLQTQIETVLTLETKTGEHVKTKDQTTCIVKFKKKEGTWKWKKQGQGWHNNPIDVNRGMINISIHTKFFKKRQMLGTYYLDVWNILRICKNTKCKISEVADSEDSVEKKPTCPSCGSELSDMEEIGCWEEETKITIDKGKYIIYPWKTCGSKTDGDRGKFRLNVNVKADTHVEFLDEEPVAVSQDL